MFDKIKKYLLQTGKNRLSIRIIKEKLFEYDEKMKQTMEDNRINNIEINERLNILEKDRSEIFDRLDRMNEQMDRVFLPNYSNLEKISVLEKDRNEIFNRIDKINEQMDRVFLQNYTNLEKISILEKDRDEIFKRAGKYDIDIEDLISQKNDYKSKLKVLEKDRDEIFIRIDENKKVLRDCGFLNIKSRIDSRIIRLEILEYYSDKKKYDKLDSEQKSIIEYLKNDYDYELSTGRTYYEDEFYQKTKKEIKCEMYSEDGLWFNYIDGHKLFWGENENDAKEYYKEMIYWLEEDTPHRYVDVEKDGIDIPQDSILLDIGAAEGYFGIKYLDKCKKVYFFEYDEKWVEYLKKSTADYKDKVEIIKGKVGDKENYNIVLDDFFKDKEKPTVIKMDIEGAEGAVLRGMKNIIEDDSLPLTMFICTYHRQDDWDRYYEILKEHFEISSSNGYYWNMQDPKPPFFRKGMMRARRKV